VKKEITIVQNDGAKVHYEVSEYRGTFYVKRYSAGFLSGSYHDIGTTKSQADVLDLVKSDAGNVAKVEIKDK
jgi:hypothetical protein